MNKFFLKTILFLIAAQSLSLLAESVGNHVGVEQICPLCNNGVALCKIHTKLYGQEINEDNILFGSKNFYVVVDNYPVCDDHILIVPKEHKCLYSVIDTSLEWELEAIIETLSDIAGTREYGLFEHGSNMVGAEQKGCGNSIYHAHMHFIPYLNMLQRDMARLCLLGDEKTAIVLKDNISFGDYNTHRKWGQTVLRYLKELPTKSPYLFCYYSNTTGISLCIPDDVIQSGVPSQFFRRVFAEYFQKNEARPFWNWKDSAEINKSVNFRVQVTKKTIAKYKDKEKFTKLFQKYLNDFEKRSKFYTLA